MAVTTVSHRQAKAHTDKYIYTDIVTGLHTRVIAFVPYTTELRRISTGRAVKHTPDNDMMATCKLTFAASPQKCITRTRSGLSMPPNRFWANESLGLDILRSFVHDEAC